MRIVIDLQACQSTGSRNRGIGRYSLSLAQAMVRNCGEHEIFIALSGLFPETIEGIRAAFEGLLPQDHIRVWYATSPVCALEPQNNWRREAAELIREAFLISLKPDVIYVASLFEGLTDDAVTSLKKFADVVPVAVTLFDLIPFINQTPYLDNPLVRDWYLSKLDYLRNADLLLSISESSRQEALEHLDLPSQRVVNISTACDQHFQKQEISESDSITVRNEYKLDRDFIMYTGGIDHRKNIEGLIRAFAKLPKPFRKKYQLAIVCSIQPESRIALESLAKEHDLDEGDVIFTGYVSEHDLVVLYHTCEVFVFPSWHEGFGLPALEAMSCGAPVIGSNTSSIPEVINLDKALFDPFNEDSIAEKITQVLKDSAFREYLIEHGKTQATEFSWDKSAIQAIKALESLHAEQEASNVSTNRHASSRPKLAFLSPLPPARSGISYYSSELLPELSQHYDIEVISNQSYISDPWVQEHLTIRGVKYFVENSEKYDRILYHFGNSVFHEHLFDLLKNIPGLVVLHDFFLSGIQAHKDFDGSRPTGWVEALYSSHGYLAVHSRFHEPDPTNVLRKYPCNFDILNEADGIIVHSNHSVNLAEEWYGDEITQRITRIPLLRASFERSDKNSVRQKLGFTKDDFIVTCYGALSLTKRNHDLLSAWYNSKTSKSSKCHLIFVGENDQGEYGENLLKVIKNSKSNSKVSITGWVDQETYRNCLSISDLSVQLRDFSRGETSAAVLDCMNYSLPVIINAHGSMADLPSDAVWMLPDKFTNNELVEALDTLYQDSENRYRLGSRAKQYITEYHSPMTCAVQYYQSIERYYANAKNSRTGLVDAIGKLTIGPLNDDELISISKAIAKSFPSIHPKKQLLIDVSELIQQDSKNGIQHATYNILEHLILNPSSDYRVEPVYATRDSNEYFYARGFTLQLLDCPQNILKDEPIEVKPGDIFLGLGPQDKVSSAPVDYLKSISNIGAEVHFIEYALLPAIEKYYTHAGNTQTNLIDALEKEKQSNSLLENYSFTSIPSSIPPAQPDKQLFIDVSELIQRDSKSGIQRVTRSILKQFLLNPPSNYRVHAVYATSQSDGYFYARNFTLQFLGIPLHILFPQHTTKDEPIEANPGDIFLGLDLQPEVIPAQVDYLKKLFDKGVNVQFVVYDLLPYLMPQYFAPGSQAAYTRWLKAISQFNGAICISHATATDLERWCRTNEVSDFKQFQINWFHLGGDIENSVPTTGLPDNASDVLEKLSSGFTFLMVGTIEPRKRYDLVLSAFDLLWREELNYWINLVFIGKQGWMVEPLVESMQSHPQLEKHFFWLQKSSDEYLEKIYAKSTALIIASEGEGFGLPLVEAAQHNLPIIARDIPVFREIASDNAFYFQGTSPDELAMDIKYWLNLKMEGKAPSSQGIKSLTWKQSSDQLLSSILR